MMDGQDDGQTGHLMTDSHVDGWTHVKTDVQTVWWGGSWVGL